YTEKQPPAPARPAVPGRVPPKTAALIDQNITVVSVLPGSAAAKAGLQAGDRITHLDGHWIAPVHLSFRELSSLEDDLGPQDVVRPPKPGDPQQEPDPDRENQRKKV